MDDSYNEVLTFLINLLVAYLCLQDELIVFVRFKHENVWIFALAINTALTLTAAADMLCLI